MKYYIIIAIALLISAFTITSKHAKNSNLDSVIPETVKVTGSSFLMGSKIEKDEYPIREMVVSDFSIGKTEVTNEQYTFFLNSVNEFKSSWIDIEDSGISLVGDRFESNEDMRNKPVSNVSWYGARSYCKWLSTHTGENYQLPAEAQWEYAAKGGNQSKDFLYAGSNEVDSVAWYQSNCSSLQDVATKSSNELGIYDMSGNVYEWTNGCHAKYQDTCKNSLLISLRGGAYNFNPNSLRCTNRGRSAANAKHKYIGFRVLKVDDENK